MSPIRQLFPTTLGSPQGNAVVHYQFDRFSQYFKLSGQDQHPSKPRNWKMNATELVQGHYHYSMISSCAMYGTEEHIEVVVKAMPASGDLCFLGLDPTKCTLSILFDGLTEKTEGTIVRMCLDNQQMDRSGISASPGQSCTLWNLEELQFSNYLVRVHLHGFTHQQFLIQLSR
ncbi:MAG: hypothetical protein AAF598_02575 [Bacteroidota bacterium]